MPTNILISTIFITLALIFYSIGVWAEKLSGRLKGWHLAFFWGGLICDTAGTGIMMDYAGGLGPDIHGITGVTAILLMIVHAIWATVVLVRKNEKALTNFHKFSIIVWIIWLIPYLNGFFAGMHQR
jgi:uncharacterized repeat protein (TIGR03987 family)